MVLWLKKLDIAETVVVVGHGADQVKALLDNDVTTVLQEEQKGSGHAVMMAEDLKALNDTSVEKWI